MIPFISFLLFVSILPFQATAALLNNNRITVNCTGSTYTVNSAYETNLNTLFSSLNAESSSSIYNSTTIGASANRIYGLYVCEGDLSPADCQTCVQSATADITATESCPSYRQGIIWYDYCMLRYSDENFFGVPDSNGFNMTNPDTGIRVTSPVPYQTVSDLVELAPSRQPMFASNPNPSTNTFAMAQCTDDLSRVNCSRCLNTILGNIKVCCTQSNGWRYLSASCSIRYTENAFYNTSGIGIGAPYIFPGGGGKHKSSKIIAVILGPILGAILLGTLLYLPCWFLKRRNAKRVKLAGAGPFGQPSNTDLPFVDLAIIQAATGNFSDANKLGEGGFGPVYKGTLRGGREIAVKRLSTKSKQGASEFKNEVKLIAKLQHRNLVRVLGCCVEREEQLLIYEYLPNKSLDAFLFDEIKRSQLDWTRRCLIIAGIARGVLYLHEDSLLKVIHRDLKASNILLDNAMNPKITDFGMSKIFETDVSDVNTGRIVGTFGYMAPEYAMDGIFSEKSDVYSFGVLLLEIVSGQKNGRSHFEQHGQTLLRHAWQLWSENKVMELIDVLLEGSYPQAEAMRVIHIGLLCVQENVEERPTMSLVVLMLRSDQMVLPQPTEPPTFFRQRNLEPNLHSSTTTTSSTNGHSINEVTITETTPR